jgi:membrane protease YdiL (CAAX protease family)
MNKKMKTNYYPNISQSIGIVGIAVLLMLIFSPVNVLLNNAIANEISFLIYYLLTFGGTFVIAHMIRIRKTGKKTYDLSLSSIRLMVLVSITMIGLQLGVSTPIVNSLHIPDFMKEMIEQFVSQKGVFSFIAIVIAAPVIEEFIFRGIILDGLLKKYSPTKSILISSILFGIVHLNPWQFISALILGSFSAWVYYRTKKLTLSILIHSMNNLIGFLSFYLVDMETIMSESIFEFYGGVVNMVVITIGAIIVASIGTYLLNKEMTKPKIRSPHNNT